MPARSVPATRVRTILALAAMASVSLLGALVAPATAQDSGRNPPPPPLNESTCYGALPTIVGDPGETIVGLAGDDVILGGGRVEGGAGDDLICDAASVLGGPGNDRIRITDGGVARGNGGDDEFVSIAPVGLTTPVRLIGGPGADVFWGSPIREYVKGGAGNDITNAGGGDDVVDLGAGNDEAYGGPGADLLIGGPGDDLLDGDTEADTAQGGKGVDRCVEVEKRKSCSRVRPRT